MRNIIKGIICSLTLLSINIAYAATTIVVAPNTTITESQTFDHVTLDMQNGSFIIKNKATLTIKNSMVIGSLSNLHPNIINIDDRNLVLSKNNFEIQAIDIAPHPKTQALQHLIQVALGNVNIDGNHFKMNQEFTAGLLITTASIATTGFKITNNIFEHFHGVLYLIASDNALISNNIFNRNSYGNLVVIGNNAQILNNVIHYAGNNYLGNAMDIIDAQNVKIQGNLILTPTCHGIYVLHSSNLWIDHNHIVGGITYAMNIYAYPEKFKVEKYVADLLPKHLIKPLLSNNITITNNYLSQNRYGVAASDVNTLTVKNNYFSQRFLDNTSRKFWTDNKVLLQHVLNLTWKNNWYKEAFSQDMHGDNSKSFQMIPFPETGGISL